LLELEIRILHCKLLGMAEDFRDRSYPQLGWSMVLLPTLASEPAVFLGLMAVRNAAATQ